LSASRFDDGWDWIDPRHDGDPAVAAEAWEGKAYYDWSQTGEFGAPARPTARTRSRALRAVPAPVAAVPAPAPASRLRQRPTRAARLERAVRAAAPATPVEPVAAAPSDPVVPGRRTVTITGRGAEAHLWATHRRPAPRSYERSGFKPDRIAMWAVLLGVLMILAAATSAHAALLHP
jgi:hypothetical protein